MTLSLDTAYRSFGGEVEASSTPTICRLPDSRRHQLWAIARAIRGGGHNGPGLSSVDDGLMIDMSMMKGVHVDPAACTVRVGPGCTQGDVDHATHVYELVSPTGIARIRW